MTDSTISSAVSHTYNDGFWNAGRDALAYTLVQAPIDSINQLAKHSVGAEPLPNVHLVERPRPQESGSAGQYGEMAGNLIGTLPYFFGLNKIAGGAMSKVIRAETAHSLPVVARMGSGAAAGFTYDALLRPVSASDENNFWSTKGIGAASSALTFATMEGVAGKSGQLLAGEHAPRLLSGTKFGASLARNSISSGSAGLAGGLVMTESESVLNGKGLTTENLGSNMATYGLLSLGSIGIDSALRVRANKPGALPTAEARPLSSTPVDFGPKTEAFSKLAQQEWNLIMAGKDKADLSMLRTPPGGWNDFWAKRKQLGNHAGDLATAQKHPLNNAESFEARLRTNDQKIRLPQADPDELFVVTRRFDESNRELVGSKGTIVHEGPNGRRNIAKADGVVIRENGVGGQVTYDHGTFTLKISSGETASRPMSPSEWKDARSIQNRPFADEQGDIAKLGLSFWKERTMSVRQPDGSIGFMDGIGNEMHLRPNGTKTFYRANGEQATYRMDSADYEALRNLRTSIDQLPPI